MATKDLANMQGASRILEALSGSETVQDRQSRIDGILFEVAHAIVDPVVDDNGSTYTETGSVSELIDSWVADSSILFEAWITRLESNESEH